MVFMQSFLLTPFTHAFVTALTIVGSNHIDFIILIKSRECCLIGCRRKIFNCFVCFSKGFFFSSHFSLSIFSLSLPHVLLHSVCRHMMMNRWFIIFYGHIASLKIYKVKCMNENVYPYGIRECDLCTLQARFFCLLLACISPLSMRCHGIHWLFQLPYKEIDHFILYINYWPLFHTLQWLKEWNVFKLALNKTVIILCVSLLKRRMGKKDYNNNLRCICNE